VSDFGPWPGAARAAVSVTVDNLGEAAEIELGLRPPDAPLGDHYSVTTALPIVLETLVSAELLATFFVEGINAEVYPDTLAAIADAGHELGYHAWCHEDWSSLDEQVEIENLDRGLAAFHAIGIEPTGFRPPGGLINEGTLELLASRGLRHCSPAGSIAGIDRVAVLPFSWPAVDVFHVLPSFRSLREYLTGDAEPGGADAVREALLASIDGALAGGGHTTLVLHTWAIELELDAVRMVLARIGAGVASGELWAAPCGEVATWMTAHPERFKMPPLLDWTSWMTPS
jgi:peptidoglycan/xylan/chitin deacetylase (PgdA/CDA1 family)